MTLDFILFSSIFAQDKPVWRGKIAHKNGVKIFHNPQEPLFGDINFILEENLSIGGTGEDADFAFYKKVPFAVDEKGNIYVGDKGYGGIQKFSKEGKHLQTIGRKGQGPGEFMNIQSFFLGPKGGLIVYDPNKIHIFDQNGTYEHSFPIPFSINITTLRETQDGRYLMLVTDLLDPKAPLNKILLLSLHKGKPSTKTILIYPHPYSNKLTKNNLDFVVNMRFVPNLYFCRLDDWLSVFGYSSELKLFVIGPSGETKYMIEKEEPCHPVTGEDKKAGIELDLKVINMLSKKAGVKFTKRDVEKASDFRKCRPVFSNILSDGEGSLYVVKFKSITEKSEGIECDLFSKEGYYLYKIFIPQVSSETITIKKGLIYVLDKDSDSGYVRLKRYKIKNWGQLKEYHPE
jgi:hypothetical protein